MIDSPKIEFRSDYIKFGRNEGHVPDILGKKQNNQNLANNKNKEQETPKEEIKTPNYVDRSAQLGASLNSLALSNMVKLKRLENLSKSNVDIIMDEEKGLNTEIYNPFAKKN